MLWILCYLLHPGLYSIEKNLYYYRHSSVAHDRPNGPKRSGPLEKPVRPAKNGAAYFVHCPLAVDKLRFRKHVNLRRLLLF